MKKCKLILSGVCLVWAIHEAEAQNPVLRLENRVAALERKEIESKNRIHRLEAKITQLENQVQRLQAQLLPPPSAPTPAPIVTPPPPPTPAPPEPPRPSYLNRAKWNMLKVGMPQDRVRDLLGPPVRQRSVPQGYRWLYPDEANFVEFDQAWRVRTWRKP